MALQMSFLAMTRTASGAQDEEELIKTDLANLGGRFLDRLGFIKCCHDAGLLHNARLTGRFTVDDADMIFLKVKARNDSAYITFQQFREALELVAEKKHITHDMVEAKVNLAMRGGGGKPLNPPTVSQTGASAQAANPTSPTIPAPCPKLPSLSPQKPGTAAASPFSLNQPRAPGSPGPYRQRSPGRQAQTVKAESASSATLVDIPAEQAPSWWKGGQRNVRNSSETGGPSSPTTSAGRKQPSPLRIAEQTATATSSNSVAAASPSILDKVPARMHSPGRPHPMLTDRSSAPSAYSPAATPSNRMGASSEPVAPALSTCSSFADIANAAAELAADLQQLKAEKDEKAELGRAASAEAMAPQDDAGEDIEEDSDSLMGDFDLIEVEGGVGAAEDVWSGSPTSSASPMPPHQPRSPSAASLVQSGCLGGDGVLSSLPKNSHMAGAAAVAERMRKHRVLRSRYPVVPGMTCAALQQKPTQQTMAAMVMAGSPGTGASAGWSTAMGWSASPTSLEVIETKASNMMQQKSPGRRAGLGMHAQRCEWARGLMADP